MAKLLDVKNTKEFVNPFLRKKLLISIALQKIEEGK